MTELIAFPHKVVLFEAKLVMKTVLKNSGQVFVHKYVVLRVLSTSCTLNRGHTMPIQAVELAANESKEQQEAISQKEMMFRFRKDIQRLIKAEILITCA